VNKAVDRQFTVWRDRAEAAEAALQQIASCAIVGYSLNGKETTQDLARLIAQFNNELQVRVQIAKRHLALLESGKP
jgi:UDP-N-acetylmuramyl tripeptide synthase